LAPRDIHVAILSSVIDYDAALCLYPMLDLGTAHGGMTSVILTIALGHLWWPLLAGN
jgi:hypothetical protein